MTETSKGWLAGFYAAARTARLESAGWITAAASLLWLPQAALVAAVIAGLLDPASAQVGPLAGTAGFAALGLVRAGLEGLAARWLMEGAEAALSLARRDLVAAETARAPKDPSRPAAAAVAALASEKLALLGPWLIRFRPAMLRARVVPLAILAAALPLSWVVVLIFVVSGPLIPVFMALVGMAAKEASARQLAEVGTLNTLLLERLQALVDIRLLAASSRVVEGFRAAAEDLRARTMAVLRLAFLSSAVLELFSAIGVAMVAVYVGFHLLGALGWGSWGGLSVGEGIFLILLAPAFFEPLRDMAAAWHDKAAAEAVAEEMAALEAGRGALMLGAGAAVAPLPGAPEIALRGVAVQIAGRWLRLPDLTVAPGEALALTGPSGVGKSTALALIAGLQAPDQGEIRVAGQPLGPDTADAWRARLGWLPQVPHFLAGSLRTTLSAGPVAPAAMAAALRLARADGVVARLPRGLLARLGETGAGVSGGEARRLMLARVALAAPQVVLADEPTADLDEETATEVTEALLALAAGGATLIVATHDARLAARMGRVVALEGAV